MIINSGNRTDIPAYYSPWFYNRIAAEEVLVRNPYFPSQITRYRLTPDVVDCLAFCTKNPRPMLPRLKELSQFRQFWFVTITPYARDIEGGVPPVKEVIQSFKELSLLVGPDKVHWRYDPIFLTKKYSADYHVNTFEKMAAPLAGYTDTCVISFIDLYEKTKRNFPGIQEVSWEDQVFLARELVKRGAKYGLKIVACAERAELQQYGVNTAGCMTRAVLEQALGVDLNPTGRQQKREACDCLLGIDIGAYNSCGHGCLYCYANQNDRNVRRTMPQHNPSSPLLIGWPGPEETVKSAVQKSYLTGQGRLF
jgi:hypothetical protein